MIRSSSQRNIELLNFIANRLEELCNDMIFVGGCITGLLITDEAAPDVRFTIDVDCIVNVVTLRDYHTLEDKLREKGFKQSPVNDHPICRWNCDDVLLDVVPVDSQVLGFSNKWYKEAALHSFKRKINDFVEIKIISAPYFLATKIEAFKDRGNHDFLSSHDLEDIISLVDGRPEIISDVHNSSNEIKQYLSKEFSRLMDEERFIQALPGHLNYIHESDMRREIVEQRIHAIINIGD